MAHDVFISYSSHDKAVADALCATLESRKIRCWIAPRDVLPGMAYAEALVNAIHQSRIFVLVFSASANNSSQVMREVERAVNQGIPIIPFRIENIKPSGSMEYFLSAPHWLDALTPPLEKHLQRLADSIQSLLTISRGEALQTDLQNIIKSPQEKTPWRRMKTKYVIAFFGVIFLIITILFLTRFEFWKQPAKQMNGLKSSTTITTNISTIPSLSDTITITGKVTLESEDSFEGILVELWEGGTSDNTIRSIHTDESGKYEFRDIPMPKINDVASSYEVVARKQGYAEDNQILKRDRDPYGFYITNPKLVYLDFNNNSLNLPDLILLKPKQVSIQWAYQTNGSQDFSGPELITGVATLTSSYLINVSPSVIVSSDCGFFFQTQTVRAYPTDFYFLNSSLYPPSFWANQGKGGVHDMGNVSIDEVTTAPDKSLGVGLRQYYNFYATDVVVGHTYCVVTMDGEHYAKFHVISEVTLP